MLAREEVLLWLPEGIYLAKVPEECHPSRSYPERTEFSGYYWGVAKW
jgi:hypothetical protein